MNKKMPLRVSNFRVLNKIEVHSTELASSVSLLKKAYRSYFNAKGNPNTLVPISLTDNQSKEFYKIYKGETAKFSVTWISRYRSAVNNTYCPLCGGPNPSQLEHYLPRSLYPEFTVFSWNLVPTCSVCNPMRGHHAHKPGENLPLVHPYYEEALLSKPLFVARINRPFSAVSFTPEVYCKSFTPQIIERLERQIKLCFDEEKFNRWLAQKMWREIHAELDGKTTPEKAREIVQRKYKIHLATTGVNSWDTIFFRALLNDSEAVLWLSETPSHI